MTQRDGMGREGGGGCSGWGTHVNPWLIHVSVWQKLLQYCKVISLQLIKINEKKKFYAEQKHVEQIITTNWTSMYTPPWTRNRDLLTSELPSFESRLLPLVSPEVIIILSFIANHSLFLYRYNVIAFPFTFMCKLLLEYRVGWQQILLQEVWNIFFYFYLETILSSNIKFHIHFIHILPMLIFRHISFIRRESKKNREISKVRNLESKLQTSCPFSLHILIAKYILLYNHWTSS